LYWKSEGMVTSFGRSSAVRATAPIAPRTQLWNSTMRVVYLRSATDRLSRVGCVACTASNAFDIASSMER
jgi:hypothetical protein